MLAMIDISVLFLGSLLLPWVHDHRGDAGEDHAIDPTATGQHGGYVLDSGQHDTYSDRDTVPLGQALMIVEHVVDHGLPAYRGWLARIPVWTVRGSRHERGCRATKQVTLLAGPRWAAGVGILPRSRYRQRSIGEQEQVELVVRRASLLSAEARGRAKVLVSVKARVRPFPAATPTVG